MTQPTANPERVAQAILRLGHDSDWQEFVAWIDSRYDASKEALVSCAASESEVLKGEARALRSIRDTIRTARTRLERFDANRRSPQNGGLGIP